MSAPFPTTLGGWIALPFMLLFFYALEKLSITLFLWGAALGWALWYFASASFLEIAPWPIMGWMLGKIILQGSKLTSLDEEVMGDNYQTRAPLSHRVTRLEHDVYDRGPTIPDDPDWVPAKSVRTRLDL